MIQAFGAHSLSTRLNDSLQPIGNPIDAVIRCIARGLSHAHLPGLRVLHLTGSRSRSEASSDNYRESAEEVHSQHAQTLGVALASMLQSCTRLQEIQFESTDMTPECVKLMAPHLGALHALTSLHIGSAELGTVGATALLQEATGCTALVRLCLQGCWIGSRCVKTVCDWLHSLPQLHEVILRCIQLGPGGLDVITSEGQRMKHISFVTLDRCDIKRALR